MTEIRIEGLRTRTLIFAACLALAFLGLLGRLAYLQVWKHDEYARLAENQHAKTVPLRPKRGPILDRGGQALAVSSRADALYVTPGKVEDAAVAVLRFVEAAARSLAPHLAAGNLVVLESTSPVGATEQVSAWLAEARPDLTFPQQVGELSDIRIAHCPERVLPGQILKEVTGTTASFREGH